MDTFEVKKRQLLGPLYFEAGAALSDCQTFEYGIMVLLHLLSRTGMTPGLDTAEVVLLLENEVKKTAGQLIAMLKRHATMSQGIEKALEEGLAARNFIVHRSLVDNAERIKTPETRSALIKDIRKARVQVQKADRMLQPLIYAFAEVLDGYRPEEIENEVRMLFDKQS
jgi:hypothetical protein